MTSDRIEDSTMNMICNTLARQDGEGFRRIMEALLNILMRLEREEAIGAEPYQRTEERLGYANGYKPKAYHTRLGTLDLQVPQTRGLSFYPKCLEKGGRSERALKLAVAQMYIDGVSTRHVTRVTEAMCGLEITSGQVSQVVKELDPEFDAFRKRQLARFPYLYLDATYLKVRRNGHVQSVPAFIACGVNEEGYREVVGVSMCISEAEVHWRQFLESLLERGLCGVQLIISDDHSGLKKALSAVLPSVPWQRCQFHLSQNAQAYAPSKEMRGEIGAAMRKIFSCQSLVEAETKVRELEKIYDEKAPEFASWLASNAHDGLAIYAFPEGHRQRLRTVNLVERLNREIKRRTRVATMFPNVDSALRLVTGVVMEIHEEWVTGKRYLNTELLEEKGAAKAA